jgi:Domain of unknown function (DUF4189)
MSELSHSEPHRQAAGADAPGKRVSWAELGECGAKVGTRGFIQFPNFLTNKKVKIMNRAFIAAAAAALAFAPVAALTAPPAGAEDDSVAVAINPQTLEMSDSYGSESAPGLAARALANCNRDHGPCVSMASTTNGCIGIARGDHYAYDIEDSGTPLFVVEELATRKLQKSHPDDTGPSTSGICSDGTSDGFS